MMLLKAVTITLLTILGILDSQIILNDSTVKLYWVFISLLPLSGAALAVLKKSFLGPAWVIIAIGGFFQYVFHTTHDPSKIMVMIIPWFIYWVIGFFAFLALINLTPPSSGTR